MTRFLVIIGLLLLPFIGNSFEKQMPIGKIVVTVNADISRNNAITISQKYYNEPPIDHLSILNNSESSCQIPTENSTFRCLFFNYNNALYFNKIPYSIFKQKATASWCSPKKRFIKLQVFRL
jgi:hypothetical protein